MSIFLKYIKFVLNLENFIQGILIIFILHSFPQLYPGPTSPSVCFLSPLLFFVFVFLFVFVFCLFVLEEIIFQQMS